MADLDGRTEPTFLVLMGAECQHCDTNCDGQVNAFDVEPFLDCLFRSSACRAGPSIRMLIRSVETATRLIVAEMRERIARSHRDWRRRALESESRRLQRHLSRTFPTRFAVQLPLVAAARPAGDERFGRVIHGLLARARRNGQGSQ